MYVRLTADQIDAVLAKIDALNKAEANDYYEQQRRTEEFNADLAETDEEQHARLQ